MRMLQRMLIVVLNLSGFVWAEKEKNRKEEKVFNDALHVHMPKLL